MTRAHLVAVLAGDDMDEADATRHCFDADVEAQRCEVVVARDLVELAPRLEAVTHVTIAVAGHEPSAGGIEAIVDALDRNPGIDLLYGDEAFRPGLGSEGDAFHKPGWSPERLLCQNYVGSMVTYGAAHLRNADLARIEGRLPDRQLHALALDAVERADVVAHLPRVLCWRDPHAAVNTDCRTEVQEHLDRMGWPARSVTSGRSWGGRTVGRLAPDLGPTAPLVNIVIPTGGSTRTVRGEELLLVENAVRSVVEQSDYPAFMITIVLDAKSSPELADLLLDVDDRVRCVKDDRPFNFAAACNLGVASSDAPFVVLLNDDTEVITSNWIERLVMLTSMDHVGAVGVKLFYADGRIQHGGVVARTSGPGHLYHGYPGTDEGHGGWLLSLVNCYGATGACLAVRRDRWDAVGGMDSQFPLNYNDIDLCLRLDARGWRTVTDNQTELTHLETSSRPEGSETWEVEAFKKRWGTSFGIDPHDHPAFTAIGVQQTAPPAALTLQKERNGLLDMSPRIWCRWRGFGRSVDGPTALED